MKRIAFLMTILFLFLGGAVERAALTTAAPITPMSSGNLRISQVYGGGGNANATYTHDFVEIFNSGTTSVSLDGLSLQYASATGTGNFGANAGLLVILPNVSVAPGQYYLVQLASGGSVGSALPTPDHTGTINMAGVNGKIALVTGTTGLGCNGGSNPCDATQLARIIDLVGYGNANFYEGSGPAPALTNSTAAFRNGNGCVDTDDNAADFTANTPVPRNSASPTTSCVGTINLDLGKTAAPITGISSGNTVLFTLELTNSGLLTETAAILTDTLPIDLTFFQWVNQPAGAIASGTTVTWTGTVNPLSSVTIAFEALYGGPDDVTVTNTAYFSGTVDTGQASAFFETGIPSICTQPVTHYIHEVQGDGMTSPLVGQTVTVQAVVVGDFQDTLGGFFIQEEDDDHDADPATSEGIFVYSVTPVATGQRVRVTGNVTEFFDLTQIASFPTVTICEADAWADVTPASFTLPFPAPVGGVDYLERYEGMYVTLPQTLYVTNNYLLGRAGELTLSSEARLPQPTNVALPGAAAAAQLALNQLNQIVIDDGSTSQNPDPVIYPSPTGLSYANTARGGDAVSDIIGVLTYSWSGFNLSGNPTDAYRIHTTAAPTFAPANPRSETPPNVGGNIQVASFNVLNYFTTLNTGPNICGPAGNMGCRGANSAFEFERQYTKIVNAVVAIDAAVIGLMEIENHAADNAVIDLVARLNAATAPGTYAYINTGVVGTDAIKQAIIYQPDRVAPVGDYAILDNSVDSRFNDGKNRPVIIQTFVEPTSGARFTVAVNHLKSKGSACTDVGDPDAGDGQGNCNGVRTDAAEALVDYLATDPTNSGSDFYLIIGDLNAYAMEDPIMAIQAAGYTNLVSHFGGLYAYGYQFGGQWGYLDHALASNELLPFVTGSAEWHINADEPIVLDYNVEFKSPGQVTSFYDPGPFRSSDHDPVIVGLNLLPNQSTLPSSYGLAWHTGHGELRLGSLWGRGATDSDNDGVAIGPGSGPNGQWQNGVNGGSLVITVTDTVNNTAAGCLYAWIDWDQNGEFDDPDERVINAETGGSGTYYFTVPNDTFDLPGGPSEPIVTYNMRVRLYESCASAPTGQGIGGEVEDLAADFTPTAVTLHSLAIQPGAIWPPALLLAVMMGLFVMSGYFLRVGQRPR